MRLGLVAMLSALDPGGVSVGGLRVSSSAIRHGAAMAASKMPAHRWPGGAAEVEARIRAALASAVRIGGSVRVEFDLDGGSWARFTFFGGRRVDSKVVHGRPPPRRPDPAEAPMAGERRDDGRDDEDGSGEKEIDWEAVGLPRPKPGPPDRRADRFAWDAGDLVEVEPEDPPPDRG